jgi:hypothetical protein
LLAAGPSGHDVRVIDVSGAAPGWLTAPGRRDCTAWRHALDPPLTRLLGDLVSRAAP